MTTWLQSQARAKFLFSKEPTLKEQILGLLLESITLALLLAVVLLAVMVVTY